MTTSDMDSISHMLRHLEEVVQAAMQHGLSDLVGGTTLQQNALQDKLVLALTSSLERVDRLPASKLLSAANPQDFAPLILSEADVLNAFDLHECCKNMLPIETWCLEIVRKAHSFWNELKETLLVQVSILLGASHLRKDDVMGPAALIKTAASLSWLDQLTGDIVFCKCLQVADTVDAQRRKVLDHFKEKGNHIIQNTLCFLSNDNSCGSDLESDVTAFKLLAHFDGTSEHDEMRICIEQSVRAKLLDFLSTFHTPDHAEDIWSLNASTAQTFLAFPKLDWAAVPPEFSERQEQLRKLLQLATKKVLELFCKEGRYDLKRTAIAKILEWEGFSLVVSILPRVDGPSGLLETLRREVYNIFSRGRDCCEADSPDWETNVQEQTQCLESIHLSFKSCQMAASVAELAISFKEELNGKIELKQGDVEKNIMEAINDFDFGRLHAFLTKPPSSGEARRRFDGNLQRIKRAITSRFDTARANRRDAVAMVKVYNLMQQALEDVGEVLLQYDINLSERVFLIQEMMNEHFSTLLEKLPKDFSSNTYDFGVVLQQLAAAQNFYNTCKSSLKDVPRTRMQLEKLETLQQNVASVTAEVREKIGEYATNSVTGEQPGRVTKRLREVFPAVKSASLQEETASETYKEWTKLLSSKLSDVHRKQQDDFRGKKQSAFELEGFYAYMHGEWQHWLSDHLQHQDMPNFKEEHDRMREKVNEERTHIMSLLSSEEDVKSMYGEFERRVQRQYADPLGMIVLWTKKLPGYFKYQLYVCGIIEHSLRLADQSLNMHDVIAAICHYLGPHLAVKHLKPHLNDKTLKSVEGCEKKFQAAGEALCKQLCKDVSSANIDTKTISSFKLLGDYARYVWRALPMSSRVLEACKTLHASVVDRVQADENQLIIQCKALAPAEIGRRLADIRYIAGTLTGWFAVYAEDARPVFVAYANEEPSLAGDAVASLDRATQVLKTAFADTSGLWDMARSFARLELDVKSDPSKADIEKAKRSVSKKHHPDTARSCRNSPAIQQARTEIMQRFNYAADCLLRGNLDRDVWHRHIDMLFSDHVRLAFDGQLGAVKSCLERGLYEEVQSMCTHNQTWQSVKDLVRPRLDVDEMQRNVQSAIEKHTNAISVKAKEDFDNLRYRSLDRSLCALQRIDTHFGTGDASGVGAIIEHLRESIMNYIEEWANKARKSLAQQRAEDIQIHSFASDLLHLGIIWCEVTAYQKQAHKKIKELLDACFKETDELGARYLTKLGRCLADFKGEEEGDKPDADDTMSHMAVAQRIVHEFQHFQAVHNKLFHDATKEMQLAPDECVKRMASRHFLGNATVPINKDDLKYGLGRFKKCFESLLDTFLQGKLILERIIETACAKAADCRAMMGNQRTPQLLTVKEHIPELLAYIFIHYTVQSSCHTFCDDVPQPLEAADGAMSAEMLKTPHNIQVLAVLKMFGYGGTRTHGLDNQFMQVRTGEGKSLLLGSSATLFAMLGFRVRCVCYSSYLSSRDFREFASTFAAFRVKEFIKYSQIAAYSEDLVARQGDIRSLTADLLGQKCNATCAAGPTHQTDVEEALATQGQTDTSGSTLSKNCAALPEVLLVDEVDVLFGEAFYGKTYDQLAMLENGDVRAILEALWHKRSEAKTNASRLLGEVKSWTQYQNLLRSFKGFEYVIEAQVRMMCADLRGFMEDVPPVPHFDPGNGGRIGYKSLDGIEYGIVHGYRTAYAYLQHRDKVKDVSKVLQKHLALLVPCGQFSYAECRSLPVHIFGVSGTVEQLEDYQRNAVANHNFREYTILPSVYGDSNFVFLQQTNAVTICKASDFHQEIAKLIKDILDAKRAVIVFFRDTEALRAFRTSSYCAGKLLDACDVLEERLPDEQKERLIKKAATSGQVTLSTSIFGRGSDFACYDQKLNERGGMHVLQTFASLDISEEVQIQGRTARQRKKGTYSMLLQEEELSQELHLSRCILDEGQRKGYVAIREACRGIQETKFQQMETDLKDAMCRDKLTKEYFNHLCSKDQRAAAQCFKQIFDGCISCIQQASDVFHYIICLDRSGSMEGTKFGHAQQGAVNFVTTASELNEGTESAVSLIMFDDNAQTTCRELPLTEKGAATFKNGMAFTGGGTNFEKPLSEAATLIEGTIAKYDRQCILFYTDGGASYPQAAINKLLKLRASRPDCIDFYAIAETDASSLSKICEVLYSSEGKEHCLSHVAPEQISGKMQEVLHSMNAGFVRKPE